MTDASDKGSPLSAPLRSDVLNALEGVRDPKSGLGLVAAGLVQGLVAGPGRAGFMMEVRPEDIALYGPVREAAEAALREVPGVERAQVVLTAEGGGASPAPRPPPRYQTASRVRVGRGTRISPEAQAQLQPPAPRAHAHGGPNTQSPMNPQPVANVRHVVAVASGKGGVGKSTVAVNLAAALVRLGLKVGLLDADVYGPSVPRMLGVTAEPEVGPDKKLIPLEAWGLKTISIGFIVEEGSPMIWRGPMASSALGQLINDVAWASADEPLDVLIVDMPPGTGDIQLTLAQKVKVTGAVLVSTPQEVALIDVRRGAAMFQKTGVPILGVVENMAYFADPATGRPIEIFGRGGARKTADDLGAPFLGEVPIEVALREAGDAGRPILDAAPHSKAAEAFRDIAKQVAASLG